jgi:hypothetical protein
VSLQANLNPRHAIQFTLDGQLRRPVTLSRDRRIPSNEVDHPELSERAEATNWLLRSAGSPLVNNVIRPGLDFSSEVEETGVSRCWYNTGLLSLPTVSFLN